MISSVTFHNFSDVLVFQTTEDILLNDGRAIPKGFVNATQILKAASKDTGKSKRWSDYIKAVATKEFLTEFVRQSNATANAVTVIEQSIDDFIIIISGGIADEQGTWVHIDVAIHLACWASPRMGVWAIKTLRHVINGDFKALTPQAEEAQRQIQQIWYEFREATKETFWFLADAIKQYYIDHPRVEKYPGQNYSEAFDELNKGLFGKTSKKIKEDLSIGKSTLNRDHFGKNALKRIEMIQRIAEAQVGQKTPVEAVTFALNIMNYEVMDYRY